MRLFACTSIVLLSFLSPSESSGVNFMFSDWKKNLKCHHVSKTWEVASGDECIAKCGTYAQANGYATNGTSNDEFCCAYENKHSGKNGKCMIAPKGDNGGKSYTGWKKSYGYKKGSIFWLNEICGGWVGGYNMITKYQHPVEFDWEKDGAAAGYDKPLKSWCKDICGNYATKNGLGEFICRYKNYNKKNSTYYTGGKCGISTTTDKLTYTYLKEMDGRYKMDTMITKGRTTPFDESECSVWPHGGVGCCVLIT